MRRWESKIVPGGFALAGLVFLFAAFKPAFGDSAVNVTFLLLGVACLVVGVVVSRKVGAGSPPPQS